MKKKTACLLLLLTTIICLFTALPVLAASKQAEIFYAYSEQDVVIVFSFDRENVDITFISPSGEKYTKADTEKIDYSEGELWATYRIKSAEEGQWYVEYDLKRNSEIQYSILDENAGIWIQYLAAKVQSDNSLKIEFEADSDGYTYNYDYELYAVNSSDVSDYNRIANGSAEMNQAYSDSVDLSSLPSGTYYLRLEVSYYSGDAEIFDTFTSEDFVWNNPDEPVKIEDFDVSINLTEGVAVMDWSAYTDWYDEKYYVTAACGEDIVFNSELETDTRSATLVFPKDADSIEISIKVMTNGIWSANTVKNIDFTKEYLYTPVSDVIGQEQIELQYRTSKPADIYVKINENEGSFAVENEGSLFFDASSGINTVYASFTNDSLVTYIVDTQVYSDIHPPTIKLSDDIDGKTFHTDSAVILGSVSGAVRLTVNQAETELTDNTFAYTAALDIGENIFEIEAYDVNNNSAKLLVTLYREPARGKSDILSGSLKDYIPLICALSASLVIFILCAVFMKKKAPRTARTKAAPIYLIPLDIISGGLAAVCIWQFVKRYLFSSSLAFLDFAEASMTNAANYLKLQRIFGISAAALSIIFVITLLITIIVFRRKKKTDN